MPCRSDYMEPTHLEKEHSRLIALLAEVREHKPIPKGYGDGHGDAYGMSTQVIVDNKTKTLCKLLQTKTEEQIKKYSLELQTWWRDHQRADRKRVIEEISQKETAQAKQAAIAKLTPYEIKILGIKLD